MSTSQPLITSKAQAEQHARLMTDAYLKYRDDFFLFCKDLLGYKDMNDEHKKLCSFLTSPTSRPFKLILMPRYTFKSSVITVGLSLWHLMSNPNLRILVHSDASTKAVGFLTNIKNHILGTYPGSKWRETFLDWETDVRKGKWNENEIIVRFRTQSQAEPTIATAGIGTALTGMHFDIIFFDDLVSDLNVTTKEQMDKTYDAYKKALSLLKPGGTIVMLGTRWHFGDAYGRIIAENDEYKVFDVYIKDAEEADDAGNLIFSDIGLTREFLDLQKQQQGSYIYSCLYCNSPTDDKTAVFKTKDFCFYGDIDYKDLYITCTVDPAGKGEDFTAICVVGTDHNNDMYILDLVNKHLQPSQIIDEIIKLHYKYKFKLVGLEENFFRGMLRMELERRITEERKYDDFKLFGVREFTASSRKGESKNNRIMGLQPYHERGALKFPGKRVELLKKPFSDLVYQMQQFPNSQYDDLLDALAYQLQLSSRGGLAKAAEPPENTAAWLEKRSIEELRISNNKVPRRFRKRIPDYAFN